MAMIASQQIGVILSLSLLMNFITNSVASARDLILVDESISQKVKIYVDRDTVHRNAQFVWFWSEQTKYNHSGELVYHTRELNSADCRQYIYRVRSIRVIVDYERGIKDQTIDYGDQGELITATPGTLGYSIVDYACRR